MLVEALDPVQARLVIGPPIRSRLDGPVVGNAALGVPSSQVTEALNEQNRGYIKTIATDAGDRGSPFPVARLNSLASSTSIGPGNNHTRAYLAHHKAGLVEVVEITVVDPVFRPYIRS